MINYIKDKFAKFQFWRVKKTLQEGRDFTVQLDDDPGGFKVTITKAGRYAGMNILFYGLQITEQGGSAELIFNTLILSNPNNVDLSDKGLVKLTSNIMRLTLLNSIEMVNKNEFRTSDSAEFDEERNIREEGSAIHQAGVSKRKPRKKAVLGDSGTHSEVQQPAKRKRTRTKHTVEDDIYGV